MEVYADISSCSVSNWDYLGGNLVAIDGNKFKAMNNRDRNFTSAKLKRRMELIESSINRYMTALDAADRNRIAAWGRLQPLTTGSNRPKADLRMSPGN